MAAGSPRVRRIVELVAEVGILAPGAGVYVTADFYTDDVCTIAIVGSSKPFSDQDGGFATATTVVGKGTRHTARVKNSHSAS
jgi:hypothetical protein